MIRSVLRVRLIRLIALGFVATWLLAAAPAAAQLVTGTTSLSFDDVALRAHGYSMTALDYYACYYFDAAVDGALYDGTTALARGSRGGDCFAEVFTDAPVADNHTYTADSIHAVVAYFLVPLFYGYGFDYYDPYGYSAYGWHDVFGGFSYYGCNCAYYLLQARIPLGRSIDTKTYQQPCSRTPSLAGPASVTRGSSATFSLVDACPTATVSDWTFSDGVRTVPRGASTSSPWSGTMVTGGTVRVTVTQGGRTHSLSKAVAVQARAWAFPAKAPTKVANGTFICNPQAVPAEVALTVPDPPTAPGQEFGLTNVCIKGSWTYSPPLASGPNQGYSYVTGAQDESTFAWTITPQLESAASDLYRAQCGRDGIISGAQLAANTAAHESGTVNSHYSRYMAAQNHPANNVGSGLEALVGVPGESSAAFGIRLDQEFVARRGRIIAASQQEPCGASDVTKDQNCTQYGSVSYAPYRPCSPSNLSAVSTTGDRVDLTWTDGSFNESGFRIERSLQGGAFAQIGAVGPGVTSFADLGVSPGTTYIYRVVAWNAAGTSANSFEAIVTAGSGTLF